MLTAAGCQELPRHYSTAAVRGQEIFREEFTGSELGENWFSNGAPAEIVGGVLALSGRKNAPLWLQVPLPQNVRIDFDAWAMDEEGDIKVELFGDGKSKAKSARYVATGYVLIFGGWNNTMTAIARKDEHGKQRVTRNDMRVQPGRKYHVTITSQIGPAGRDIRWEIDGDEVLSMSDPEPLGGPGNDAFAFSGWEAETRFDNLVIEEL